MFSKTLRLWPWLAAVSSGLLYAACFPPFDQASDWLGLTPAHAAAPIRAIPDTAAAAVAVPTEPAAGPSPDPALPLLPP